MPRQDGPLIVRLLAEVLERPDREVDLHGSMFGIGTAARTATNRYSWPPPRGVFA